MFREMRRIKQQVSEEECKKVLNECKRGVLSLIGDDGYPYGVPLDFLYVEAENRIYFHGAKQGHKIDAIKNNNKACFTTYNKGFVKEGAWELNPTSVIAFGKVTLIEDAHTCEDRLFELALKYYPSEEEARAELGSAVDRVQVFVLDIEHMTGKLVNEK